jgi:ribosome-associated translation inhibitor RaiA
MSSKRIRRAPAPEVQVTVRGGEVPEDSRDYAADKVGHVADHSTRPVLYAHVVLEVVGDPARTRPALAEATLDVNGTLLRAHVAAAGTREAVDLLEGRLRRQLVQLEGRVQNRHHRTGVAGKHAWRHGDLPQERPEYRERPVDERTVVRHKMLAVQATTPDEAVGDMEQVGHDFYLFTDRSSGQDAVVYRLPAGGYGGHTADGARLSLETSHPGTSDAAMQAALPEGVGAAAPMTEEEAVAHLDLAGDAFVFHLDPDTGRGRVLYRRYDGHYGLITAG